MIIIIIIIMNTKMWSLILSSVQGAVGSSKFPNSQIPPPISTRPPRQHHSVTSSRNLVQTERTKVVQVGLPLLHKAVVVSPGVCTTSDIHTDTIMCDATSSRRMVLYRPPWCTVTPNTLPGSGVSISSCKIPWRPGSFMYIYILVRPFETDCPSVDLLSDFNGGRCVLLAAKVPEWEVWNFFRKTES